ncbi:MAG: sulfotransferase family protein [Gammaproteobacteria bacterium]
MTLPVFLGIGAQKSGTSTLNAILKQHPDIFLPTIKEIHFFDSERNYAKGVGWYEAFFRKAKSRQITGEFTPDYMFSERAPDRMHEVLGKDVKLIFILRDPVDRAYSQYFMALRKGSESLAFPEIVDAELQRPDSGREYFRNGLYARQIERYLNYFDKENMFFMIFETDFLSGREAALERLCAFLGVPGFRFRLDVHKNRAAKSRSLLLARFIHGDALFSWLPEKLAPPYPLRLKIRWALNRLNTKKIEKPSMSPEVRKKAYRYFNEDIARLEEILGRDLSVWKP